MIQFIGALISGLNLGSIYALIALGYTMVYGIAKMLNFAHGDIIMVGAYSVIVSAVTLKLPPVVAILIAVVVCAALGVTIEFLAYRPLRQSPPLAVLITAIGVSYLLQNLALLIFGPEQKSTPALFDLPSLTLGELSLGHAGFMSVGLFTGCTVAVLLQGKLPAAVCLPLCMVIGGLAAALVGLVVGLPALRLGGDYLAIVTLGCGEIIKNVLTNLNIKGTPLQGALGIDTSSIRRNSKDLLPYAILLVLLTMLVIMNFKRSKHGRAIMAIRDNRIAAEATGVNVVYYKLMVFMLAAFFAGAAGVLYGYSLPVVQADTFGYNMSIEILVIVVLGGMGNIGGSILAAIVLRALPEALRDFSDYRMLAYSVLLIAIMLLNENKRFKAWKSRFSLSGWFRGLRRGKAGGKEADAS